MRCTNQGADYSKEDIQWSCTASLPAEFKLGSTEVICEGYDSADDPRVLKGSCGVEYRLVFTEKGEERYGSGGWFSSSSSFPGKGYEGKSTDWSGYLFSLIFVGVLIWIIYSMYAGYRNPGAGRRPAPRGGGWGGGWGGGDDPPPPYPGTSPYPGKRYEGQEGWRPGFWSGVLGGAAAGYMAGNRGNRQQTQPEPPRSGQWFGGGGRSSGGYTGSGSSGNSSSSGSSARYESTGFGSTSRR